LKENRNIPITLYTILTHTFIRIYQISNCTSFDNFKCHHSSFIVLRSSTFWVLYVIIYILYYNNNSIIGRLHLITRSRHFTWIYCAPFTFVLSNIRVVYKLRIFHPILCRLRTRFKILFLAAILTAYNLTT